MKKTPTWRLTGTSQHSLKEHFNEETSCQERDLQGNLFFQKRIFFKEAAVELILEGD